MSPGNHARSASGRRIGAGLVVAVIVAAAASFWSPAALPDNSLPAPGWELAAKNATTKLGDGQFVTLNVKSNQNIGVNQVEVHQCRLGPTYSDADGGFAFNNGDCPPTALSSNADVSLVKGANNGLTVLARSPDGANFNFRVGVGVAEWNTSAGLRTLTCDPANPCALVTRLEIGIDVAYQVTPISFVDADPVAGCGGPADGVLASGGSDELIDAWSNWTRTLCARDDVKAPTRASFGGENTAIESYSTGLLDLVYTGAGYSTQVGVAAKVDPTAHRPSVAIPIGLNAAVVAAGNGSAQTVSGQPIGDRVPYAEASLKLTSGAAAAVMGGGPAWAFRIGVQPDHFTSILSHNPPFNGIVIAPGTSIMAPSLSLTSTFVMTNYLATLAPDQFIAPEENPSVQRAPTANLAISDPPYGALSLFTGRPVLAKAEYTQFFFSPNDGPLWVFTDRVTAKSLNLTPFSLQNADGDFVTPTEDTMDAAVSAMTPDENGLLHLKPTATATTAASSHGVGASASTTPYPLTYVEYALVPAQPLVDQDTCVPRAESQKLLVSWLQYVLGEGQTNMPAGLEPLPPSLLTKAQDQLQLVGASPVTGKCASTTVAGATATTAGVGSSSAGVGASAAIPGLNGVPAAAAGVTRPDAAVRTITPAFVANHVASTTDGLVALVGIVLVMSLGVYITSRSIGGAGAVALAGTGAAVVESAPRTPPKFRIPGLALLWILITVAAVGLVVYVLGPMFEQRAQKSMLKSYSVTVKNHANLGEGLQKKVKKDAVEQPPEIGAPVGVVEIGAIKAQQVALEGIGQAETSKGPGHVPGTAGLGQLGNSVVVARRNAYGGAFRDLSTLTKGEKIVVTTLQGRSIYAVKSVSELKIIAHAPKDGSVKRGQITSDELFGPSDDNRLTFVTSADESPLNASKAVVVVAKMRTVPFAQTRQGALTKAQTNLGGDSGAWSTIVLALAGYALVIGASVFAYRRMRIRVAYVLTIPPLVALTIITAEALSHLIPTWT